MYLDLPLYLTLSFSGSRLVLQHCICYIQWNLCSFLYLLCDIAHFVCLFANQIGMDICFHFSFPFLFSSYFFCFGWQSSIRSAMPCCFLEQFSNMLHTVLVPSHSFRFSFFTLNHVPFSFLLYSCFIFLAHTKIYCTYVIEVSLGISAMKSHYSPSDLPVLFLPPLTVHLSCAHFIHSSSSSLALLSFVHSCCWLAFYLFIFNCISLCTKTATLADACTSTKCMRLLLLLLSMLLLRIKW